jgi:N,N'-diacetyllegionaminate synthase
MNKTILSRTANEEKAKKEDRIAIRLRKMTESDLEAKTRWSNDPDINSHIGLVIPIAISSTRKWFQEKSKDNNIILFIIEDAKSKRRIGYMRMDIFPKDKKAELHLIIGENDYWGKGIGTKATLLFLKIAFKELKLNKVFLTVGVENHGAIRVYEKSGFKKEGIMRADRMMGNKFRDVYIMSILKEEYEKLLRNVSINQSETGDIQCMKIGDKIIGEEKPVFIIAEAGVNHNGDLKLAMKLVDIAKEAGADAVKFQIWQTEKLILRNTEKVDYQKSGSIRERTTKIAHSPALKYGTSTKDEEDQFEMLKKLELSLKEHKELMEHCKKKCIMYLCTPTDEEMVDFLIKNNISAIKIGSGELTNLEFLKYAAKKNVPLIFSTGMGSLEEVRSAIKAVREYKRSNEFAILHCTTQYPAPPESANLRAIELLKEHHPLVGFSDHTKGNDAAAVAVSLGACIIEKHFTLDKNMDGPDHKASLDPIELRVFIRKIRQTEIMLGRKEKNITEEEEKTKLLVTRSAVAAQNLKARTKVKRQDIEFKRPGDGILSSNIKIILGKKLKRSLKKDEKFRMDDLE